MKHFTGMIFALFLGYLVAANANAAPAKWTSSDVEKFCYNRADGNARKFADCKNQNARKVGRPIASSESYELKSADKKIAKKIEKAGVMDNVTTTPPPLETETSTPKVMP